jgi:hypothetical protein
MRDRRRGRYRRLAAKLYRGAEAARAYLEAGAAGLPCAELAVELAQSVLGHPDLQLALQVLEGGPFAHARATELACRVLAVSACSSPLSAAPEQL